MNKQKFDKIKYFKSIKCLVEKGKINFAKRELQKFLNIYPNDEYAIALFVRLLFKDGEFDRVIELSGNHLENPEIAYYYGVLQKYNNNIVEAKDTLIKSYSKGKDKSLVQYITILIKENKYTEAYNNLLKISDEYKKTNKNEIELLRRYIYKEIFPELNEVIKDDFNKYFSSQIANYDINLLYNRLENNKMKKSKFINEKEIIYIVQYVSDKIEKEEPSYYDLFDRYIVKYPNVGLCEGKNTDYLMTLTNLNTKDIVNIYPYTPIYIKNVNESNILKKKYVIE